MSARTRPGSCCKRLRPGMAVRAMVVTVCPRLSTIDLISMRDQRLVLDDHHVGGHLIDDSLGGFIDQGGDRVRHDRGSRRCLVSKSLPPTSAERLPAPVAGWPPAGVAPKRPMAGHGQDCLRPAWSRLEVQENRFPQAAVHAVERNPAVQRQVKAVRIGDQRFKHPRYVGVAAFLSARQGPRKAPQVR